MKAAKLGAVFLVAVMALAGIGAAYAHWEETLTISGVMTTDDIDPVFECQESNDPSDTDGSPGRDLSLDPTSCGTWTDGTWDGTRREKDVGYMNCVVVNEGKGVNIVIGDAYPCYYSHAYWCVTNYGSCPVLIHSVQLKKVSIQTDPDDENTYTEITLDNPIDLVADTTYYIDYIYDDAADSWSVVVDTGVNNPEDYDYSIMPTGQFALDTQLDPHSWGTGNGHMEFPDQYEDELEQDMCVHFENGCRQSFKYDFEIDLVFYNWPEYVTPE